MLGVMIFAMGVLALGKCAGNCIDAERMRQETERARLALGNRMAEVEAGEIPTDKDLSDDLGDSFPGMTLKQSRKPVAAKNEKGDRVDRPLRSGPRGGLDQRQRAAIAGNIFLCAAQQIGRMGMMGRMGGISPILPIPPILPISATPSPSSRSCLRSWSWRWSHLPSTVLWTPPSNRSGNPPTTPSRRARSRRWSRYCSEQFTNLPAQEPGALLGVAHKFGGKDSDEIAWLAQTGNGLFTQAAAGEWKVTLILRPQDKTNTYTLGLLRQLPETASTEEHWLPLLPNVDAIQVRYFDQRLNTWVEQWNDVSTRPALVRLRIWRTDQTTPYEAVIELPPTRLPS